MGTKQLMLATFAGLSVMCFTPAVVSGSTNTYRPAAADIPASKVPVRSSAQVVCGEPSDITALYPLGSADGSTVTKVISQIGLACFSNPEPDDVASARLAFVMAREFPHKVMTDLGRRQLPSTYQYQSDQLEVSAGFAGTGRAQDPQRGTPMVCYIYNFRAVQPDGALAGAGRTAVCVNEHDIPKLPSSFQIPQQHPDAVRRGPAEPKSGPGSAYTT
jgi:hypothetical protein